MYITAQRDGVSNIRCDANDVGDENDDEGNVTCAYSFNAECLFELLLVMRRMLMNYL